MPVRSGESREDYLEAILILKKKKGSVRSVDIANHLNFTKASVSRAMSLLREAKLVAMDKEGWIEFTAAGQALAEQVYDRHTTLKQFLVSLGVNPKTAEEDACRMEHIISMETFERIKAAVPNPDQGEAT